MILNLMLIFKSIILGVVEGITEFLPISSTGHMIIVGKFINFSGDFAKLFEIVIQLGAILAVVFLYRVKILNSFKSLKPNGEGFKLWTSLMLAFLPAGIVGLLFHKTIEEHFMNPVVVATALFFGGLWMIFAENKYRANTGMDLHSKSDLGLKSRLGLPTQQQEDCNALNANPCETKDIAQIGYKSAFIIGCFQCLSILWPGFSRSAATIIGGWIVGLSSSTAAEFSFFLAIPTMIIATGFSLLKAGASLNPSEIAALCVGFVFSFVVALAVVAKFIEFLKTKSMRCFAIYRIIIGLLIMAFACFKLI